MNETVKQYIEAGKHYLEEDTLDKFFLSITSKNYVSQVRKTLEKAGIDVINNIERIVPYMYFCDTTLLEIVIPSNISIVGSYAFVNCNNLKTVVFEEGCEIIEEHAFSKCNDLRTIVLPRSVKYVDRYIASGTPHLFQIEYKGTSDDWELIKKATQWSMGSNIKNIVCSDKTIETGR